MHSATNYICSEFGLTSPILIHLYTIHLNSHLLEDKKLVIVFLKMIGTSFFDMFPCFRIEFHVSTFLHIRHTLIAERMSLIMTRLTATFFVSNHHIFPKIYAILDATLDKRSWELRKLTPIFSFSKYIFCILWDPGAVVRLISFQSTWPCWGCVMLTVFELTLILWHPCFVSRVPCELVIYFWDA